MNTRSGEILSALIAIGVAIGTLLVKESPLLSYLRGDGFGFILLAFAYASMALYSALTGRCWSAGRFMSGVCWGSLVLLMIDYGKPYPLAFIAVILFGFDIYIVIQKGLAWTSRR